MSNKTINQNGLVLDFLEKNGSITNTDAFTALGVTRLANNICDLRKKGLPITDEWEENPNRYGKVCRYKRYFLGQLDEGKAVQE